MWNFFGLFFGKSYWRILLRQGTWAEARRSLRRAHKDKRARKHLLAVSCVVIAPLVALAYFAWLVGSGAIVLVPFVLPVLWWRARRARQDDISLSLLQPIHPPIKEISGPERKSLSTYYADHAFVIAIMIDRASSEVFARTKTLPEGVEIISRRRHLQFLRDRNLLDRLAPRDRNALLMADGHWDIPLVNEVFNASEPLRLLRWVIDADHFLPLVGQQLTFPGNLASEVVNAPEKLATGRIRDLDDIDTALDGARIFYTRCVAEAIHREVIPPWDDELKPWATDFVASLAGKQHEDIVLGHQLVSEAPINVVLRALEIAAIRLNFLKAAQATITEGKVPENLLSCFDLGKFPSLPDPEVPQSTSNPA